MGKEYEFRAVFKTKVRGVENYGPVRINQKMAYVDGLEDEKNFVGVQSRPVGIWSNLYFKGRGSR